MLLNLCLKELEECSDLSNLCFQTGKYEQILFAKMHNRERDKTEEKNIFKSTTFGLEENLDKYILPENYNVIVYSPQCLNRDLKAFGALRVHAETKDCRLNTTDLSYPPQLTQKKKIRAQLTVENDTCVPD